MNKARLATAIHARCLYADVGFVNSAGTFCGPIEYISTIFSLLRFMRVELVAEQSEISGYYCMGMEAKEKQVKEYIETTISIINGSPPRL
jgi:hypothetical protein